MYKKYTHTCTYTYVRTMLDALSCIILSSSSFLLYCACINVVVSFLGYARCIPNLLHVCTETFDSTAEYAGDAVLGLFSMPPMAY